MSEIMYSFYEYIIKFYESYKNIINLAGGLGGIVTLLTTIYMVIRFLSEDFIKSIERKVKNIFAYWLRQVILFARNYWTSIILFLMLSTISILMVAILTSGISIIKPFFTLSLIFLLSLCLIWLTFQEARYYYKIRHAEAIPMMHSCLRCLREAHCSLEHEHNPSKVSEHIQDGLNHFASAFSLVTGANPDDS